MWRLLRVPPLYRRQGVILIGVFLPWITSIMFVVGIRPFGFMDLTPLGFALSTWRCFCDWYRPLPGS